MSSSTSGEAPTSSSGDASDASASGTSTSSSGEAPTSSSDASDASSGDSGDGSVPVDCSGVTIAGVVRQTVAQVRTNAYLANVDVTRYAGIWEAHNAQTGDDRSTKWGALAGFALGVYRGQYVALAFETTADQAQIGQLFREADAALASAWSYWSISRCPGDFTATTGPCHAAGGAVGSLGWEIGSNTVPNYCHLEPNTTYYVNILFGTSGDPAEPSCSADVCGHVYQQTVSGN
ncbi:hypothetical protein [Nannocystis sp. SCPEA4]|uniref:hypothetical protein n=1 Tax=Nannocystis sp. SCPEA4 TaxID=2996787 RepID=UPI002270703E|nr:hypothetical protein [Nannocystis sp. SCPEA4]MCY1062820.1 hypothetical protein [Nannocystis sp. SCPEA4]